MDDRFPIEMSGYIFMNLHVLPLFWCILLGIVQKSRQYYRNASGQIIKKDPGDLRPIQRILRREPLFFILIQEISNLIEFKIVGQDIYIYAFHVCLK
jgi:hypothetical protein